jgi:tRNA threonylcarbamoyladenosine biosynthesis protein TsaE
MQIISKSVEETQNIAKDVATDIIAKTRSNVVLLEGELGGGKTTFSQGFLASFGVDKPVTSPTFVIMKSYSITDSDYKIYHLDLYRLNQEWEVLDLGIMDIIQNPNNILLIEWASKTPNLWKNIPHTKIEFEVINSNERIININP